MSFLNGILLAGAAAFLIPLLIHLLNKRRVQTVRWGAMHLLQEVLKQRKRRFRIEQWLLLMTMILVVKREFSVDAGPLQRLFRLKSTKPNPRRCLVSVWRRFRRTNPKTHESLRANKHTPTMPS